MAKFIAVHESGQESVLEYATLKNAIKFGLRKVPDGLYSIYSFHNGVRGKRFMRQVEK